MDGDKALSVIYIFLRQHSVCVCLVLTVAFLVLDGAFVLL